MNRIFAMLGKLFIGAFLLVIILGIGYFVGTHKNQLPPPGLSETKILHAKADPSAVPTLTLSPSQIKGKTASGGLAENSIFSMYTFQLPQGWNIKRETTPKISDKVTLSKNNYTLTIYQASFGGGECTYSGQPQSAMAQGFTNFTQIGNFRRSWNEDLDRPTIPYTICQKGNSNSYSTLTTFGRINAEAPNPVDKQILSEMDSIVASIQKQ